MTEAVTDGTPGEVAIPGDGLALPPTADAPRLARRHVRERLAALGRPDLEDSVVLAASELVTNATIHARTDLEVRVEVGPDGHVRLSVTDGSATLPEQRQPDREPTGTTGRGLQILQALGALGVEPDRRTGGKTVWFEPFGT